VEKQTGTVNLSVLLLLLNSGSRKHGILEIRHVIGNSFCCYVTARTGARFGTLFFFLPEYPVQTGNNISIVVQKNILPTDSYDRDTSITPTIELECTDNKIMYQ
jgi:hypothetical protein